MTIPAAALDAYGQTATLLQEHAPEIHRLAVERVDALTAVCRYPEPESPLLESRRGYVERVHARQWPIPPDQCGYDDGGCYYEHVSTTWLDEPVVVFAGTYPEWTADGEDYRMLWGRLMVPFWVLTEPGGYDRYRAETTRMAADLAAAEEAERQRIGEFVDRLFRETAETGVTFNTADAVLALIEKDEEAQDGR